MTASTPRGRRALLALDVGGTKTLVAAVDPGERTTFRPLLPPVRFATPRDPLRFLDELAAAARRALPDGTALEGIGIGAPGPLDAATGDVVHSTNLGWRHLALARLVSERFGGVGAVLDDDGNAAALGEARMGSGRGADPFAFITLGTGLGVGVVIAGRLVSGAHGAAGELGHLAVGDRLGPRCGCGSRNCVEVWCAGKGMARRAHDAWPSRTLPDGGPAPSDAEGIFALARRGEPEAVRLVGLARRALATAVAAICSTLDPTAISVGGTIGLRQPRFVSAAVRDGLRLVHPITRRGVQVRLPELGALSVLAGAAVLAGDQGVGR